MGITESEIEQLALDLLQEQGFEILSDPPDAKGATDAEAAETATDAAGQNSLRESCNEVLLKNSLQSAIDRLNPDLPPQAREDAFLKVCRKAAAPIQKPLIEANERFHKMMTEGIAVEFRKDSETRGGRVRLLDFQNPANNEWRAINQFAVTEKNNRHRADIVLFVNGLPIVVIELKKPDGASSSPLSAFRQLQTYKERVPSLFVCNSLLAVSDGWEAKAGSLSADWDRFAAWPSIDGERREPSSVNRLSVLIKGALNPRTLLDLIQNFTVFEKTKRSFKGILSAVTEKKTAACHQYHAANKALKSVVKASMESGNRKGGVIWHTQGSGKSLTMAFTAGKIIRRLNNPTLVVITDRNDLDNQLFDTFAGARSLLRQDPVQAKSRSHLKELLKTASGGVIFTTIQKFHSTEGEERPQLSDRKNIVVIADEAHRSQYGFQAKTIDEKDKSGNVTGVKTVYGFAKHMRDALPFASYLGWTGTPVESADKNTKAVFGAYVDIYDIALAVKDKATVPIFYESRMVKVNLDEKGKKLIRDLDRSLEDISSEKQKKQAKWAGLEALIGSEKRIRRIAEDIVSHFEKRQTVFKGKGMIVVMSRRIAVNLYREIIKLRPDWHDKKLNKGKIKIVMTTFPADESKFFAHKTTKEERRVLADRMRDPDDDLNLAIVVDMWLTGFNVPCLHTLYIDKPLRGHNLMQAIARVNRVYKDKPGGLVADYLGIVSDLKKAMAFYSSADGGALEDPLASQEKAVALMLEKREIVSQIFHGFDYKPYFRADTASKLRLILDATEYVLALENGEKRFIQETAALSRALALAVPHEKALELKEETAFFQAVRARLVRLKDGASGDGGGGGSGPSDFERDTVIRQTVDKALAAHEPVDVFSAAGMRRPDISILSDEFLLGAKSEKRANTAAAVLKKLLSDEIKSRMKLNVIQRKSLEEALNNSIKRYHNKIITAAEVIEELIKIAKDIQAADKEPEKMNLSREEYAFWTAVANNGSARELMGKDQLRALAVSLTEKVRKTASIDWQIRESARARLRVMVKRLLRKYGYPPDMEKSAVEHVLKQAESFADQMTASG